MSVSPHDFTRPPRLPPGVKALLADWLKRGLANFEESLTVFGIPVQSKPLVTNSVWPLETFKQWTGKPVAFHLSIRGAPSILAMPNRLAQSLAAGLLGDSLPDDLTERELTSVELDLCELVAKTFLASLIEAWTEETPLDFVLRGRETNLRRCKLFRPNEPIKSCQNSLAVSGHEHLWSWMVRLETLSDLFGEERSTPPVEAAAQQRRQMESVVRGLTLPLSVKLGHAQLTAPQLAELRVGDVVVLNQRTTEPLKAMLSGRPAFLGWPGRIDEKQAFQIEAELAK